jgi:hypothetical protein
LQEFSATQKMLSIAISNLDLAFILGGGFAAVSIIMGLIAYASLQTMKSVKADNRWKEFAFWRGKEEVRRVNTPAALQAASTRLLLPAAPSSSPQLQLTGLLPASFMPSTISLAEKQVSRQEVLSWHSPNPVMPTLYNDFAGPDTTSLEPNSAEPPAAAPPPFEDIVETKPFVKTPLLANQGYRIVIQNPKRKKRSIDQSRATKTKNTGQIKERTRGELESKQEQERATSRVAAALPAPPPPIDEAILSPQLTVSTPEDEIETPLITKKNVKNLINKKQRF